MTRGQADVVGVALLVGVAVLSLGAVVASVGPVIDAQTARADAARVAEGFDEALRPAETTGRRTHRIAFASGRLATAERDLRVYDGDRVVTHRSVGALRFEREGAGATFVAGAVVRTGTGSPLVRPPGIRTGGDLLVINAPVLRGTVDRAVGPDALAVSTTVSHARTSLGPGDYRVAIEVARPRAVAEHFRDRGYTVARTDEDGDGVPSVVVAFPDADRAVLLTHETEVTVGG